MEIIDMNATSDRIAKVRRAARARSRGVTLVEVLIVMAIMALISGGAVFLVFPELAKARVKAARLDGQTIRKAVQVYMQLEGNSNCPTVQDMVGAKKLEAGKTNDPWGKPYRISCTDDDVRVISSGKDGKEGTPDDVPDNLAEKDVAKVADM